MKRSVIKWLFSLVLVIAMCASFPVASVSASGNSASPGPSKAEIQEVWKQITYASEQFLEEPSVTAPYSPGQLSESFLQSGITYLNYVRFVANLPAVVLDDALNEGAQYGAVLLAAEDNFSHYPSQPADMDDDFYNRGLEATTSANLAVRWGSDDPLNSLQTAVLGCMNDKDSNNLSMVGHRRWLLNPTLGKVGFGYAESSAGRRYVVNRVHDRNGAGCDYDFISWPAEGNHPTNLFNTGNPWSVTLNPSKYQTPSADQIEITITRESDGRQWTFDSSTGQPSTSASPYMTVDTQWAGIPNCIIFHPGSANVDSYTGVFTVNISGIYALDGTAATLNYQVDFFDVTACIHDYRQEVLAPTCTKRGYTTYTCTVCGDSYKDHYTAALGHDWEGLTCQRCGEVNMPFTDVKPGKHYYYPVIWAVENGITNGTTPTTFEPNKACTRWQVVTFLWRAAGCPEPTITTHSFTDVSAGNKAVLWAVEKGITSGTTETTFSPGETCNRWQIVTFLWRAAGCPTPTITEHSFTDVSASNLAVLWAVEEGITTGTTATKFSPNDPCTRGQVVTFLWRAKPEEVTPEEPLPDNPPPADAEPIHVTETIERTVKLTTMNGQTYWRFDVNLYNPTDKTVSLKKIITQNLSGGIDQGAPYVHEVAGSHLETMFDLVASPGETINWVDDHPVTYTFNGRRYTLELEDSEGNTYTKTYVLTYSYEGYHNPDAENAPGFGETGELTAYVRPGDRWDYTLWFRNNTDKTLCLKRMECEDYNDGTLRGPKWVHELPVLQDFFIPKYLAPGQVGNFQDGHPYVEDMDTRIYSFVYEDADGTEYTAATKLTLSSSQLHPELDTIYPDFSGDNGKDAFTLRHNADFAVEVGDGVYWVPANALGKSDYTNAQIQAMVTCTPEEKQARIDTLHEALQLYQIGGFYGSDDNVYIQENGLQWEHHKPGYHAVRTNHGCCATSANWLHYILDGDYEEIGYYSYYGVGGGHVFNYIKQGDWYYFADLTTWPAGNINVNAVESGDLNDFYNSDPIGGNILRAASLEAFADYILENHADPPGLIYTYLADDVTAKADEWYMDGSQALVMPDTDNVTIQYDDPDDSVTWRYNPAPVRNKDWTRDEDFLFDQMQFQ